VLNLAVKVTPRSATDEVVGRDDSQPPVVLLRVTAQPTDGQANIAVIKLIAAALRLPKSAVQIKRGGSSRHKLLSVETSEQALTAWLDRLPVCRS
jgi:uncharacterized protein YggU (UPF0235/DUF167 family)